MRGSSSRSSSASGLSAASGRASFSRWTSDPLDIPSWAATTRIRLSPKFSSTTASIPSVVGYVGTWVMNGAGAPNHLGRAAVTGRLVRGVLVALGALLLVASAVTASAASVPSSGSISAGSNFTCGTRTDGTLVCWGDNGSGQVNPVPSGLPGGTFSQVSSGFSHACAIGTNGSLACWGDNSSHEVSPLPTDTFSQVSSGNGFTCAVKTADQTLTCWGDPSVGWTIPTGTFSQVSSGGFHACGLRTGGAPARAGFTSFPPVTGTPPGALRPVSRPLPAPPPPSAP